MDYRHYSTNNPERWRVGVSLEVEGVGYFTAEETWETMWQKYSRRWHSAYGPARICTGRKVWLDRGDGPVLLMKLTGWRGKWRQRALEKAGITKGEYVALVVLAKLKGDA